MNYLTTGNTTVDQLGAMNFTGNVIPQIWYKTVVGDNKKPNHLAIAILADIVYWYRPTEIRDERSGQIIGWKKKFHGDMLQRTYTSYSLTFRESEKTVIRAIVFLEHLGVIRRHRKTLHLREGLVVNGVLFLELIADKLMELTYPKQEQMEAESEQDEFWSTADKSSGDTSNCPKEWTELSMPVDKFVRIPGQNELPEFPELSGLTAFSGPVLTQNGPKTVDLGQFAAGTGTKTSRPADKTGIRAGQIRLPSAPDLSSASDKFVQANTENTTNIITESNTKNVIYPSISPSDANWEDGMETAEKLTATIRENIGYDIYSRHKSYLVRSMFEGLYQIICDVVCTPYQTIRVNETDCPAQIVKKRFLELTGDHLMYVIESINAGYGTIRNTRGYMITCLYNALDTMEIYYQRKAMHDMVQG